MTDATYRSVNRAGWDQLTSQDSHPSRAYGPEQFTHARQILDPAGWFPWRRLRTVLCLAAGGGQQGPLFASLRRIEGSLIGRQVKVTPAAGVPKAHRLVLADHSEVQIIS